MRRARSAAPRRCLRRAQRNAAAVAPPPVDDKGYPDFSLIKINGDDDSLAKIQKKGLVVGTSNDWPYSFLDPKTNEWTGLDGDVLITSRRC